MGASKSKQELQQLISKTDVLGVFVEEISQKSQDAAKRSQEQTFIREARKFVNEQRDVILIAVKVR